MAATTTQSTTSKLERIIADHPALTFQPADTARWSPMEKTVYYSQSTSADSLAELLHEIGHALLGHDNFTQDISLVSMELEAWQQAQDLASKYDLKISDEHVENSLDSYRDWLHARSRCPTCQQAGIQAVDGNYSCLLCQTVWQANDARQCGLKRYKK